MNLTDAMQYYEKEAQKVLEAIPDPARRLALASDPNAAFPQLFALAFTNPDEVGGNAALALLMVENPDFYQQLQGHIAFASLTRQWGYGWGLRKNSAEVPR